MQLGKWCASVKPKQKKKKSKHCGACTAGGKKNELLVTKKSVNTNPSKVIITDYSAPLSNNILGILSQYWI